MVDEHNELLGLITVKDIANANMDLFDTGVLASARTSYRNVLKTLGGEMICGDPDARITTGRIFIVQAPRRWKTASARGTLCSFPTGTKRRCARLNAGRGCIVVCCGAAVPRSILAARAGERLPHHHHPLRQLRRGAADLHRRPVRHFMRSAELLKFSVNTPIEGRAQGHGQRAATATSRFWTKKGRYCGVVSRRNLLNLHRKQIILVDHNEPAQAVDGAGPGGDP